MKHNPVYTVGCGAWIGGTMTVPGVSGGSMAMILGIYDKLISSVNGVLKKGKRRESIAYLAFFMAGAVFGLLLFAKLITLALTYAQLPTSYFFVGCVAGAIPMIFRAADIKKFHISVVYLPLIGIIVALCIAMLPEGLLELRNDSVFDFIFSIIIQLFGGVFIAIAIVLPGVSFSQVLLVLGLHGPIMEALASFDIVALLGFIPLAIGTAVGIFLVTHFIELALNKFPRQSYLIIFGFILGSLPDLVPRVMPTAWEIPICFFTAAAGFLAIFFISKREQKS